MSTPTRKDWILWGALGCALAGTAHAEYTLAVSAHFNQWVALAVPGALDLYVLRALQQRRDVFVAVLAMVAANVTAHLLTAGVLHEHWAITSAAGALAPLILWRVYSLKHTRTRQELLWGAEAGAVSAPAPEAPSELPEWGPGYHLDGCDGVHPRLGPLNCVERASALECIAPDHVPADWMDEEYPETHPSAPAPECTLSEPFLRPLDDLCSECGRLWGDHSGVQAKRAAHLLKYPEYKDPVRPLFAPGARTYLEDALGLNESAPHLHALPDLPPEYAPGAVHSESPLKDSDLPFLAGAQEYVDNTGAPSVRGLKAALSIGQERADRLLTYLGVIL